MAATGFSANSKVALASAAGVKHFLAKPFSAEKLLNMVWQVLHHSDSQPPM
jgi:DNA-binding NtrC family response regulator